MRRLHASASVVALMFAGLAGNAVAQGKAPAESFVGLEEVVVTAQKREESLQDTPISLSALTAHELENAGITDVTDLRSAVPNLQVTPHPNSATTARVFIRGIGNNDDQVTQDPSVAVYLDGVYMARSQGLAADVAELERVEVLRGPQGSLYGRNATGGAINFITRAPELGAFHAEQQLMAGSDNQFRSRTRVNIPLGDRFAAELSYLHAQRDGFVDNVGSGVDRFGDQRRDGYRAALRWLASDTLELRYSYDRSDVEDTPVFLAAAPFYPALAKRPERGSPSVANLRRNDITAQGHNLTAEWNLGENLTVKSITAYRQLANKTYQNFHSGVVMPLPLFVTATDADQDQFTEELQLIGDALDGRLQYVAGAYYFDENADSFDQTFVPARGVRTDRTVTIHNKAYAVFGQATYTPEVLDGRLHVTAGVRWSRDERAATLRNVTVLPNGAQIPGPPGAGDNSFENISPSLILAYDINDDVNVYAKAVKGYKSGGFNVRASSTARFEQGFAPESLWSYEAGLKSSWLDNRLRLNAAAFVSDYKDIQINIQSDPTNVSVTDVLNAGAATIKGVELELTARPIPSLRLSLDYAYLDAGYDKVVNAAGQDIAASLAYVEAPKSSIVASLEYDFPQTPIGQLTAYVDYAFQDKKFTTSSDRRYIVGSYGLLNARLTLSDIPLGAGDLRLALFGRNLTDEDYYVAHFNAGVPTAVFGEPRSYGVEMSVEF